jgi:DNA mismatch endonuclease (patch repair protein)
MQCSSADSGSSCSYTCRRLNLTRKGKTIGPRYHSILWYRLQSFPPIIPDVDNVSRIERSKQMALVCSKNTKPEMLVRRLVHGMGYRYRLHQADLPGRPDLVFRSQHKVVFIHGCFWHGHKCRLGRMPKSRPEYWRPKINGNRERDVRTLRRLRRMRWRALVLWECQLKNLDTLTRRLQTFLG